MVPSGSEILHCPLDDIASYLDGELSSLEEARFESHLKVCGACRSELNDQKEFLFALNASLETEKYLPLPKDFTKTIVANAESSVSGLRRPRERFTAILICVALAFIALFALEGETPQVWSTVGSVAERIFSVGSMVFKFILNIFFAIAVIARSLSTSVGFSWAMTISLILMVSTALFVLTRSILRSGRTQEN